SRSESRPLEDNVEKKSKTGNDSSAAVPSSAVRSPWEREPWALDCWPASEPQKQVAAFHREMRHCFASQRRSSYSRPTFGYNTTNSAASRITKFQAAVAMKPILTPWKFLTM